MTFEEIKTAYIYMMKSEETKSIIKSPFVKLYNSDIYNFEYLILSQHGNNAMTYPLDQWLFIHGKKFEELTDDDLLILKYEYNL